MKKHILSKYEALSEHFAAISRHHSKLNEADLIEIWSPDIEFEGEHKSDIDVTGGIGLKAARGAKVAQNGIEVMMVSGQHPQRVTDACIGVATRGTKVVYNH